MMRGASKAITLPPFKLCFSSRTRILGSWLGLLDLKTSQYCQGSACCLQRYSYSSENKVKSRNQRVGIADPRWPTKIEKIANLEDAREAIEKLLHHLRGHDGSEAVTQEDKMIVLESSKQVLRSIVGIVEKGNLNPSGKHGLGLSSFMELIMYVYCQLDVPSVSMFENCQEILDILKRWNLDVRSKHYEYAIVVANRENRWNEAARLFWKQIEPEAGYNPVNVSISSPHGLLAIVRFAQEEGSPVADHVFDAVNQLTMVSPSDQQTYILAAGTALGQAGEWESALEYLRTSYTANGLEKAFVASVMQACLLSRRPDKALEVYDTHIGDIAKVAGEWQWGGERDTLDPLCRDLRLRAMKSRTGTANLAKELFQQIEEEVATISLEALYGVISACEHDNDVEGAVSILFKILENVNRIGWIVPGAELFVGDCESELAKRYSGGPVSERWLPEMGGLLVSVLRACNSASKFGTALFCLRIFDLGMSAGKTRCEKDIHELDEPNLSVEETILPLITELCHCEDLLGNTMTSLCGLRCYDDAIRLFDAVQNAGSFEGAPFPSGYVYEFALSESARRGPIRAGNPWLNSQRHIHKLTTVIHLVKMSDIKPTAEEARMILACTATAMNCCTNAHQADLSVRLLAWTLMNLKGASLVSSSGVVMKTIPSISENFVRNQVPIPDHDQLVSELIRSCRWNGDLDGAIEIFQSLVNAKVEELHNWKLTCSMGLSALVAIGRGNDAWEIFKALGDDALTSDTFFIIGQFISKEKKGKGLDDVYRSALDKGLLSEDLSLLAMSAVINSHVDNRLRTLRIIVDETSKIVGTDNSSWMQSRYWLIKRSLGFYYARLLMWWNDPETCHIAELALALKDFQESKRAGLKVKHDVLRAIVANATVILVESSRCTATLHRERVPNSRAEWAELLRMVIEEARFSSIYSDQNFVADVVEAYQVLECNRECVDYIRGLLMNEVRLNKRSIAKALECARQEKSFTLANDLEMLIMKT